MTIFEDRRLMHGGGLSQCMIRHIGRGGENEMLPHLIFTFTIGIAKCRNSLHIKA